MRVRQVGESSDRFTKDTAERALFTAKRKEAYEALHPETRHGAVGRGGKSRQLGDSSSDRFAADTAEKTGRSERDIQRDAQRKACHLCGRVD
jgi:ParB family transcriptional regulator, chromosome partitioning protein